MERPTRHTFTRRDALKAGAALAAVAAMPAVAQSTNTGGGRTVIVIGAGVAGLAAATRLRANGFVPVVLESRNRIGGRVWTDRTTLGFACDMGAGWIHGPDGDNPITPLARQANARTFLTNDESVQIFDVNGADVTTTQSNPWDARYRNELIPALDALARTVDPDISVEAAIRRIDASFLTNPFMVYPLTAYAEFDAGGPIEELSTQWWRADAKFPGKDVIFPDGYDAIPTLLSAGLDIRLNTSVTEVDTSGADVRVVTSVGTLTAPFVVCTVPLGVLQTERVRFTPSLPDVNRTSISRMKMGFVNKVFCQFNEAFWPTDTQYFGYHAPQKGLFAYWLNYRTFSSINCLVAIASGNGGRTLEGLSNAEITAQVTTALRNMFGSRAQAPTRINPSRWLADTHALGAYTFPNLGATNQDYVNNGRPVADKLFFAGEHTVRPYSATVHGAYLSGLSAANALIGAAGTAPPATGINPQTGWYWNPAENGRGFFLERQGSNVFMAGYLYEADGRPTWFTAFGPMTGNTFAADMATARGGQTLTGPFRMNSAGPSLGRLTLTFTSDTACSMTWPGGTVSLARFAFAAGGAGAIENGWWWAANEPGRGYSIEIQGNTLFMVGFMYDDAGNPVWFVSTGAASATGYTSTWLRVANGQTLTGVYKAPDPPTTVGTLAIAFAGPQSANLTLPDGRLIPLTRFPFRG